ncbi:MAG: response regulator transcription factor [Armatimonadetes bacterium]|nr:response regulator transcription factor [Armatimonadota bacterium]
MKVLIVEDDEVIGERLQSALKKNGFEAEWAQDGDTALEIFAVGFFGMIILDINLPKRNGIEVCREIRKAGSVVPILMLTARDAIEDRVKGLDAGADDYLIKPFAIQEVLARIRALTRRTQSVKQTVIRVKDLVIDTTSRTVELGGVVLHLTPREYQLLEALARNLGRTLSRETIIERVWNDDLSLSNTVNFHVTSLRKKIDTGRESSLIETVHGFGYRMGGDSG